MIYDLPTAVEIQGASYEIRSDFRAVLDICAALNDPELNEQERAFAALYIFYPQFETIPQEHLQEALNQCCRFINCGEDNPPNQKRPRLMDWEQDFPYIVAPVNRVIGQEIRAMPYLHWWTFISAYYEIGGECTFAQIVRVRDKKARGKQLDKSEKDWYKNNRHMVDFKTTYTDAENDLLALWGGKENPPG